jgi:iron complex transport system substrate-binding protein
MRIATLLPAATEIVCALGLRRALVGRSHECDWPEDVRELPALTRSRLDSSRPGAEIDAEVRGLLAAGEALYEIDEQGMARAGPEVVVTQEACAVCAVSRPQVVAALHRSAPRAAVLSLAPARLHDVIEDVRRVADACGVPSRGARLAAGLAERVARARATAPRSRPRVAVIEWLDPPMLAGHWIPDVVEAAGGHPLGPSAGTPSVATAWDEVAALRPDAVLVAPCGFDLPRTLAEIQPVSERLRAAAPRVLCLDGNAYFNRPAPRLVDALETVAGWLRGEAPRDARVRGLAGGVTAARARPPAPPS